MVEVVVNVIVVDSSNNSADVNPKPKELSHTKLPKVVDQSLCSKYCWKLFDKLCFIFGLIYFDNAKQIPCALFLFIFSAVNIFSFGFNFYIISCPYQNCSYIDLQPAASNVSLLGLSPLPSKNYHDYQKFLFTCASFSGTASYFLMVISLNIHNLKSCCPCLRREGESSIPSPFSDDFSLKNTQTGYFFFILFGNFVVFIASAAIFFTLFALQINRNDSAFHQFIDSFGFVSQFISWFCAILSCFIFSKVAYAVANTCTGDLYQYLKDVATDNQIAQIITEGQHIQDTYNRVNEITKCNLTVNETTPLGVSYFSILKDIDQWYIKRNKSSLRIYSCWFAIHWLMYAITAFVSLTYVLQHVVRDLYGDNIQCRGEHYAMCRLTLTYDLLFAIGHCILFIYPCFRAATVTSSRYKLIRLISRENWILVPLEQKLAFLQYLNSEDGTFKVSILCATMTFGFNLAYFSIFAGIMTVILKISL